MKTPFSSLLRTRTRIFGPRQRPGPVLRLVAIFVVACAAALLLAAGSPLLQAQDLRTAPADQAAFDDLVVGQRMALDDDLFSSFYYVEFVAAGRFRETESPRIFTGSYTYENTGPNTGTLTFNFDDGARFTERLKLVFTSTTAGTGTSTVNGGKIPQFNWRLNPIPESEPLRTLYFPDYVDGGAWSVQLAVSHIGTTEDAAVLVAAYDRDGQSIPGFFDFDDPFEIPPLGTRVFRSAGAGEARRGWIEVKTDTASVSGLLTYRNTGTGLEVSVEPVELGNHFALFVEESSGIGTGLAIFKPDPASTIEFRIRDEDGIDPLGEGFVTHPVGGETFQQRVGSIPEWFDVEGIDTEFLQDFQGILLLRAEDGSLFAPVGIRFGKRGESLSAVPVIQVTDKDESNDGGEPDTDDQTCATGSVIRPGAKCNLKDADGNTIGTFDVANNGTGCLRIGNFTSCSSSGSHNLNNVTINQYRITFVASRGADGNWTISKISIS